MPEWPVASAVSSRFAVHLPDCLDRRQKTSVCVGPTSGSAPTHKSGRPWFRKMPVLVSPSSSVSCTFSRLATSVGPGSPATKIPNYLWNLERAAKWRMSRWANWACLVILLIFRRELLAASSPRGSRALSIRLCDVGQTSMVDSLVE